MFRNRFLVRTLLVFAVISSLSKAYSAQSDRAPAEPDASYRLGAGDGLTITVWGHTDLSGRFTVATDGTISFPLLGTIVAADRPAAALQSELTQRLADGFLKNPRVVVDIEKYVSQRVFVIGEVHTPGAVALTGRMSLLEVLARAGSLTEQAGGDIVILRPGPSQSAEGPAVPGQSGTSELARLAVQQLRRGAVAANYVLRDGDTVFVPRAEKIYVLGLVSNPGPYTHEPGMTVQGALSLAGGTTALGSQGRTRIVRVINGKRTELKAVLDDVLQPGDTLMIGARRF